MRVSVIACGLNTEHEPEHRVDQPARQEIWIVMCFSTPFIIKTSHGIEQGVPGDCIVHDPTFPMWHGSVPGEPEGFRNDWLLISGDIIDSYVQKYRVPLNTRIASGDDHLLSALVHNVTIEQFYRQPFYRESIAQDVERMFMRIGRSVITQRQTASLSFSERKHRKQFMQIRTKVMQTFQHPWTIAEMAQMAALSPNRFSVLYRQLFQASPLDDLIRQRIQMACQQLVSSDDTLETIARRSGFTNVYYFSRLFRKHIGFTPGAYRRDPAKCRKQ